MSGAISAIIAATFAAAAGGTSPTFVSSTAGTVLTNNANPAVTFTVSAGDTAAIGVFFFDGAGARTLTSAAITGETVNTNASSQIQCTTGCHLEWLTVNSFATGGSKTCTVTLSGNSDECYCVALVFSGAAATPVGIINVNGSAFASPADVTLAGVSANSSIVAICQSNMTLAADTGAGWTNDVLNTVANGQPLAQHKADNGAAGSKTVTFTGASGGVWAISALEIKKA